MAVRTTTLVAAQTPAAPLRFPAQTLDLLQALAASARAPVFVRDLDGRFVLANAAYAAMLACDPASLAGRPVSELFPTDEAAALLALDRELVAAGRPLVSERDQVLDGARRRFLVTRYPLKGEDGAVVGVAGILTEISAQGSGAGAAGLVHEHVTLAFAQAPIGAALFGLDLSCRYVNQALCRLTGCSEAELLQRDLLAVTQPGDGDTEMCAVLQLMAGVIDEVAVEQRYAQPDGTTLWGKLRIRLVRAATGEPLAFVGFVEDITAQKGSLAAVARSERIQRALAACSQRLVVNAQSPDEESAILAEALESLRAGAGVLRVNLFENFSHPTSGFSSRVVAEALAPGDCPLSAIFAADYHIPWSLVPERNLRALATGNHIGGPVQHTFAGAPEIIAIEQCLGIGTVQFFPVVVHEQWWGYLCIDDRAERDWDEQEVLLIRTAAEIIGAFLQRNRDAATLSEREAMLRVLGDNLPDSLLYQLEELPNGQTRRTYLSRGLEQRTGVSAEQALANIDLLPTVMHPDDVPAYEARVAAARRSLTPYEYEHRYIAADGSVRWLYARSSPRRLADGRVLWDGIAFDTTVHRQLQEALREANLGLSRRIDELSLLNQVAHLLGDVSNLSETLELVCQRICEAFTAAEVLVALRADHTPELPVVASYPSGAAVLEAMLAARVVREGDPIVAEVTGVAQTVLIVALRAQGEIIGLLQVRVANQQQPITPDTVSLAQTIGGAIASAAANARLYTRAVQSSERLERLNAASRMINSAGLDLPALYTAIYDAVRHLIPVEAFVISLVEPGSEMVEHALSMDRGRICFGVGLVPLAQSFAGFMRSYGPSLRIDDFLEFYTQHPEIGFEIFGDPEDTRSGLAASFITADGLYGLLFAQCYPPGAYGDEDLLILELLAAHAATAIENARRAQQVRRAAVDEERNRLARDLHDSVSQSLFSASMIAERLPDMARISVDEAWAGLSLLHQLVRGALVEMRALLIELRPTALAAAPLHQALAQLAQAFAGRRGAPIQTMLDPAPRLPQDVQVALYRIVQEGLNNAIKHAQAASITVQMVVQPPPAEDAADWNGTITLMIRDNGRGFAPDQVSAVQLGLGIMRERAQAIGARITLTSEPGQGTSIALTWHGSATQEE